MVTETTKPISGTREWAVANIDCCTGCPHDCRYCYARYDAVERKGTVKREEWPTCSLRPGDVERDFPLYGGTVMFPTTHDIVPEILDACVEVIRRLIKADNRVLVVTKPHLACIRRLCGEFSEHRESILFRFTITARDNELLSYWEPGAPAYSERKGALVYAYEAGFETSVSIEPMLDSGDVVGMFKELVPYVTDSIWIGKMNRLGDRVEIRTGEDKVHAERIAEGQSDSKIMQIYHRLKDEPLVRWKESIKRIAGIPLAQQPGLDI